MCPQSNQAAAAESEASHEVNVEETQTEQQQPQARPEAEAKGKTQTLPPYAVVLHNDECNSFEFVILSLQKVFAYPTVKAMHLTTQAHARGRAIVWSGHRELAELKASQLTGRGADPVMAGLGARPLRVTVEAMPQ